MMGSSLLIWERNHPAALDAMPARENQAHRFGVNAMLLDEDARGKRFIRIVIAYGHHGLRQNRPGIEILIHQMHGAAAELHAVFERLPLRLKARERRQQRWVNVEDALRKRRDKMRRQQP